MTDNIKLPFCIFLYEEKVLNIKIDNGLEILSGGEPITEFSLIAYGYSNNEPKVDWYYEGDTLKSKPKTFNEDFEDHVSKVKNLKYTIELSDEILSRFPKDLQPMHDRFIKLTKYSYKGLGTLMANYESLLCKYIYDLDHEKALTIEVFDSLLKKAMRDVHERFDWTKPLLEENKVA